MGPPSINWLQPQCALHNSAQQCTSHQNAQCSLLSASQCKLHTIAQCTTVDITLYDDAQCHNHNELPHNFHVAQYSLLCLTFTTEGISSIDYLHSKRTSTSAQVNVSSRFCWAVQTVEKIIQLRFYCMTCCNNSPLLD